ncbi:sugar ABC transporter substrate-binding protein [Phytoactinopolyspora alkaliphila]|uniref:Sugar ABC transporter substrate-binding protein n=1 Tax=Phytoactinopolyspora alkaliphila TaxID=1783498 RepID=A0A6N9YIW9_9ACTN|nr:sugar ABC transporter substrate-binding protein [Phytoactinopolyspora alkaliphila]NED94897.1 sugar ABC transporter substrate-binding protein [Phytoactinopolyspora alkaliphila]
MTAITTGARCALAAGLVVVLGACGLSDGESGDPDQAETTPDSGEPAELSGEITFSTLQLSPDFDDYINAVIADFEALHDGVTVNWVDLPFEGATERLLADASAGELPDVMNLNPDLAYPLANEGTFIDLDQAAGDVRESYIPGAWDSFRYPGHEGAYGFPWYLTSELTMYNADLFEEAGLDREAAPESFEELFAAARTVAEQTGAHGMHLALENRFITDLRKRGVEITDPDATAATFNTPEAVAHVAELRALYEDGAISADSVTEGHRQEIEAYQGGQIALFPSGPNFLNIIEENAPDIAEATMVGPQITGERGVTGMSVMGLLVPASTDNRDLALEFAAFMTNGENQLDFAREVLIFPSVTAALQDEHFTAREGEDSMVAEAIRITAEQLPQAENLRPVVVDDEVNQAVISNVQGAILGQLTPEEALEAAEAEVNDILDRRNQ